MFKNFQQTPRKGFHKGKYKGFFHKGKYKGIFLQRGIQRGIFYKGNTKDVYNFVNF